MTNISKMFVVALINRKMSWRKTRSKLWGKWWRMTVSNSSLLVEPSTSNRNTNLMRLKGCQIGSLRSKTAINTTDSLQEMRLGHLTSCLKTTKEIHTIDTRSQGIVTILTKIPKAKYMTLTISTLKSKRKPIMPATPIVSIHNQTNPLTS